MERTFHVIEDFLSAQECAELLEMIEAKAHSDEKPNFRVAPLYSTYDIEANNPPHPLVKKVLDKIEDFFLSTHEMYGDFVFSRTWGNIMDEGSYLDSHRDEDPNPNGEYDGKKRSHVCSLLLNDDYEGGDLVFQDQNVSMRPKPGSLVLFPGYYVSHGVKEVTKGSRVNILAFFYDMLP